MTTAPDTDRSEFVAQSHLPGAARPRYGIVTKLSHTRDAFLDNVTSGVALDPPGEFGGTSAEWVGA